MEERKEKKRTDSRDEVIKYFQLCWKVKKKDTVKQNKIESALDRTVNYWLWWHITIPVVETLKECICLIQKNKVNVFSILILFI